MSCHELTCAHKVCKLPATVTHRAWTGYGASGRAALLELAQDILIPVQVELVHLAQLDCVPSVLRQ